MRRKQEIFIQPPHLTWDFIRKEVEKFRLTYVEASNELPIPIEKIVEISMKIEPFPIQGLMDIDIDGFLCSDLKTICIDADIYQNPRKENRLRFTFAHEIGHWVLHKEEISRCSFRNPVDWIHFREDFLEEDLNWFEQQAYEFAGRLLVPKNALLNEIDSMKSKINRFRSFAGKDLDRLIDAIARVICQKFAVSPDVLARRIRHEKIKLFR